MAALVHEGNGRAGRQIVAGNLAGGELQQLVQFSAGGGEIKGIYGSVFHDVLLAYFSLKLNLSSGCFPNAGMIAC